MTEATRETSGSNKLPAVDATPAEASTASQEPAVTVSPTTNVPTLTAEPTDENSDDDSALGDDAASSTASITSSIMAYRVENGRTYHSFKESINYVLPNDAPEQDRLDLQHHAFQLTFHGKIFLCPAGKDKPIGRCLDAGTGTGVWALDFADEHPHCEVVGIDLSPIQPNFVPPNLSFQIDDLEENWTFDASTIDFVFARMLTGSISDWPRFFSQAYTTLTPGGWLEVQDIGFPVRCDDGTLPEDSYLNQWSEYIIEASNNVNRGARGPVLYKEQMQAAGFTNIHETVYKWPMNKWPADPHYKELGYWCYQNIGGGLSGISMALFTRALGWTSAEVEVFMTKVRGDMKNRNIHAYWPIHVVYAQKPE